MQAMPKRHQYEILPKILKANEEQTITIRGLYAATRFKEGEAYKICVYATEGIGKRKQEFNVKVKEGAIVFKACFEGEQEFLIWINQEGKEPERFNVYALNQDLYDRFEYKGDLHAHSSHSDGQDSHEYVACAARKNGYDFIALTDHNQFKPSLEMIKSFENVPIDIEIYRGEEIHIPAFGEKEEADSDINTIMHFLNINGSFSITDLYKNDLNRVKEEVEDIADSIKELDSGVDKIRYAKAIWAANKIKQAGGLSVLCHIYWLLGFGYYIDIPLAEKLLRDSVFDAYELISGYDEWDLESNALQVSKYHQLSKEGKLIPVVGVSDEHGVDCDKYFGWYYTIVFSPSSKFEDVKDAIVNGYSVAVENMPGNQARVYGDHRLVKYSYFLIREVFPYHDSLCYKEGLAMEEYVTQNKKDNLVLLRGNCDNYRKKIRGM